VHLRPLLREIPFVGAVSLSFLRAPELDFELGGAAGFVDAVPGLGELLRRTLVERMAAATVAPKAITVHLHPSTTKAVSEVQGIMDLLK